VGALVAALGGGGLRSRKQDAGGLHHPRPYAAFESDLKA